MQYFAHTRKACGPIALALALSACGDKSGTTDSSAASQPSAGSLSSIATQNYERLSSRAIDPAQSRVTEEFSNPALAGASPLPSTTDAARSSAPGAPAGSNFEKILLADGTPVLTGRAPNLPAAPGTPVSGRPGQPGGDTLPVMPPEEGVSDQPPANGTIEEGIAAPPAEGGDPLVTLIAKTNSGLNASGTQLEWTTENVDECETSGAWQGTVAPQGTRNLVHESSGEHTYMISCRGASGTAMAMVTVSVESTALAWEAPENNTDGSELTDLAGYNLYYGTESGRYTQVRPVRDASQTALDLPVEPGTYYLAMTAYDMSGNESELSNEIVRIIN